MKKIAVISTGYLWFPCESGYPRMFDLCVAMSEAGFSVDAYVPSFQHHNKAKRDIDLIKSQKYPMDIITVPMLSYKRNIGVGRLVSNGMLAHSVKKALEERISEYDAVLVTVPPNDVAAKVVSVCKKAGVPCIADIEDLWPEAMAMVIKNDSMRDVLLSKFKKDAEFVYSNVDAVAGTADDYTERAFKEQDRDIPSITAYVGVNIAPFDEGVKAHQSEIIKPDGEFWVTYAGSISTSYDIESLVKAAEILENTGFKSIRIKLLGKGSKVDAIKKYILKRGITSVDILGFMEYEKMAAFLTKSDCLVNSFIKTAPQSVVNKVGDYLAAGRPMINSLENPVFCNIISKNKVGINVESENPGALCDAILRLYNDPSEANKMGKRARSLCEKEFDREKTNAKIIDLINEVIGTK